MNTRIALFVVAALQCVTAHAQDAAAWLASQGLEPRDVKAYEDMEVAIGRAKEGGEESWEPMSKEAVAKQLVRRIADALA